MQLTYKVPLLFRATPVLPTHDAGSVTEPDDKADDHQDDEYFAPTECHVRGIPCVLYE